MDYFLLMIEALARRSVSTHFIVVVHLLHWHYVTLEFQNRHIKTISSIFHLSMEWHSHDLTTGCLRFLPNKVIGQERMRIFTVCVTACTNAFILTYLAQCWRLWQFSHPHHQRQSLETCSKKEYTALWVALNHPINLHILLLKPAEKQIAYFDPKKRPADRDIVAKVTAFIRCRLKYTTTWKITPTDIPL